MWERPALRKALRRSKAALGKRLLELRREHGWSQEHAAEKAGLHAKHVQRMEAGNANPTLASIVALAVAYGVGLDALFPRR